MFFLAVSLNSLSQEAIWRGDEAGGLVIVVVARALTNPLARSSEMGYCSWLSGMRLRGGRRD